jgi:PAS domain-containing protein
MEVVDSVPAIGEFLTMGFKEKVSNSAKDKLQESQQRNRAILEASADAILVLNQDQIIEEFNGSAERLFGYKASPPL